MSIVTDEQTDICTHTTSELRLRTLSDGRAQYTYQCVTCGAQLRTIKKTAPEVLSLNEPPPPFNTDLQEGYWRQRWDARRSAQEQQREAESAAWWQRYDAYLQTSAWRAKRQKVLQRANGICEGCGEARATQVHHLRYDHVGNEFLFELVAICIDCHQRLHSKA